MNKYILDIARTIIPLYIQNIIHVFLRKYKALRYSLNSIKLPIIDIHEAGEAIKTIKDETIETAFFPKIYNLINKGEFDYICPKLELMKYQNATVFPFSDFIQTHDGAVWGKFHKPQFTKIIPLDKDFLKIKNKLFIKKPNHVVRIKTGFSLCGVHSTVWAHFLVQYLPKLYLIPELRKTLNQDLTILLPKYTDLQIQEIVYSYLKNINGVEILELEENEVAICGLLYHIENTAFIVDDGLYITPWDVLIPKFVAQSLKNNFLANFANINIQKETEMSDKKQSNIYIARSGIRNVRNSKEIEEYFLQKGFILIYPHTYTLFEKIAIFQRAGVIVGPFSSGFTNIIFSKPKTKVLVFSNFQRTTDTYFGFIAKNFDIDIMLITGDDKSSNQVNSSYTIPLNDIESACIELGIL